MPLNATLIPIASFDIGVANITSVPVRVGSRGLGGERTAAGKRTTLTIYRSQDGAGTNPTLDGTIAVYGMDLSNPNAGPSNGNAFAATTPSAYVFMGDGTTVAFQTNIPYVAFSNNNWLVEMPGFKLSGTFAVTTAGVVSGTSGVAAQAKLGDKVMIGGFVSTITAYTDQDNFTITPAPAATIAALAVGYNLSIDRRFKTYAASVGSTNPELFIVTSGATVNGVACGLITFAVAPPKLISLPAATTPLGGVSVDVPCIYFGTPTEIKATAEYRFDRSGIRTRSVMWAVGTVAANKLSAARVYLEHAAD